MFVGGFTFCFKQSFTYEVFFLICGSYLSAIIKRCPASSTPFKTTKLHSPVFSRWPTTARDVGRFASWHWNQLSSDVSSASPTERKRHQCYKEHSKFVGCGSNPQYSSRLIYLFQECITDCGVSEIHITAESHPYYRLLHFGTCSIPTQTHTSLWCS